ncbi:MAG: rod shape-determining protein RodA [Proteobacteria bacterium]|nr:rod shape-determining protein RodA [Pseudomonadota bacterium]
MSRLPLALAALATGLGLAALFSATSGTGSQATAQCVHAILGLLAFSAVRRIDSRRLPDLAHAGWLAGVLLLVAVLVAGKVAGGARSWLPLGPMALQPSELMKVLLPLVLAAELTRDALRPAVRWARVAALILVPVALIAKQPDMGAVGLLLLGAGAIVWLAGIPRRLMVAIAALGALATPIGWTLLEPYQQGRILTFLDPTRDPSGAGYQTLQSLYTTSAGGWTGAGFGAGVQGRLGFLPEHETDFILASVAEDAGVFGAIAVLAAVFALIACGMWIAERSRTRFEAMLAAGLSLQLTAQVLVNAGGVLGLLPLTGVTLPFVSYGGSSLIVVWVTAGLLSSVAARREAETAEMPVVKQPWLVSRKARTDLAS